MENSNPLSNNQGSTTNKLTIPSELLIKSWKNYQANLNTYMYLMLIPIIGLAIFYLLDFFSSTANDNFNAGVVLITILFMVVFWYFILRSFTALFVAIHEKLEDPKQAWEKAKGLIWSYLLIGILTGLFVFLWSLLFIIPGIIFSVYYSMGYWALITEGKKGRSALKRSKELIQGYWWAVAGRGLFLILLYFLVFFIISLPSVFVQEGSMTETFYSLIINSIYYAIMPLSVVYTYYIYTELMSIKANS